MCKNIPVLRGAILVHFRKLHVNDFDLVIEQGLLISELIVCAFFCADLIHSDRYWFGGRHLCGCGIAFGDRSAQLIVLVFTVLRKAIFPVAFSSTVQILIPPALTTKSAEQFHILLHHSPHNGTKK